MGLLYDDNIVKKLLKAVTKYCGTDLTCINVKKGDSYTSIFEKINDAICRMGFSFSTELEGCTKGLVITNLITTEVVYSECLDCDCQDCSELDVTFSKVEEERNILATVTGGSGNYTYEWSTEQSEQYGDYYKNPYTTVGTAMILGPDPTNPAKFKSLAGPNLNMLSFKFGPDILINLTVTDTETGCTVHKAFLYENTYACDLELTFSKYGYDEEGTGPASHLGATVTVTGGTGTYKYNWSYLRPLYEGDYEPLDNTTINAATEYGKTTNAYHIGSFSPKYGIKGVLIVTVRDTVSGCEKTEVINAISYEPA